MKKILLAVLITFVVLLGIGLLTEEETETTEAEDYKTYSSEEYSFEIDYPKDFALQEKVWGAIVAFISPKMDQDDFKENFLIFVENLSANSLDLKEYNTINEAEILANIENARIINSEETTLGGYPAHKLIYSGKGEGFDLKWIHVVTIKEKTAFDLIFTAEQNEYENYLPEIEKMIQSFKIKEEA